MQTTYLTVDADEWLQLIRAEYLELPGLSLTLAQAQRLWSLDAVQCRAFLDTLVRQGFLAKTPDGMYCRTN